MDGLWLKLKLQLFGHLMQRAASMERTLMLRKGDGKRRKGAAEDEMIRKHHQLKLSQREFVQTLGDSGGQRSLACCSPWGHKG